MSEHVKRARQQRIAGIWLGVAAAVGLGLTVVSVLAGLPLWLPLVLAMLTGLKTGLAITLFRREWVSWSAGDARCRGVVSGNPAFGADVRCRLRAGHDGSCRP